MCNLPSLLSGLIRFILAILFGDWLPIMNFFLQLVALLVLIWYASLTRNISVASQDQAEAGVLPCLTLATAPRQQEEAVLGELEGRVGAMVVSPRNGNVVLLNIGNGPAINARYQFTPINPPQGANVIRPSNFLPIILAKETFITPVAHNALPNLQYEVVLIYESLSGRHYESRIRIDNLVLTDFRFKRLGRLHAHRVI